MVQENYFYMITLGLSDPDRLVEQIQYFAAEGKDVVILDHLTIVVSGNMTLMREEL